jgi:para-aminobenzoate synthetase/4-amino-4-deoxychorismate lyase
VDRSVGTRRSPSSRHLLPAADLLAGLESQEYFVLLESSRPFSDDRHSYLFTKPVEIVTTVDPAQIGPCLERLDGAAGRGLWAAGYFSYELGYCLETSLNLRHDRRFPLLWFGLFPPPAVFDHDTGEFTPPLPDHLLSRSVPAPDFNIEGAGPEITEEGYRRALRFIKNRIVAGDTYQVNFTTKYRFRFRGSPAGLYLSFRENQPVPFAAFLRTGDRDILSASPELFFRRDGLDITLRPMKGTMARGRTGEEDRRQIELLAADPKNRAENVMIVDLVRNDLGRVCLPGSIETEDLFHVEKYESLLQMTSTVRGRLREEASLHQLLAALFPCGSVTGAPKIRTMEIIGDLEKSERGVYCGAIGFLSPGGRAVFSVPIRTAVLEGNEGEMGIGSGIVADSNPRLEYGECILKGRFLTRPRPPLRLIETVLWEAGSGFRLLEEHLERMGKSADYFDFPFPRADILGELKKLAGSFDGGASRRVRLLLGRDGSTEITGVLHDSPAPEPLSIRLACRTVDSADPYLFHKTTRREVYDRELAAARKEGFFEVVFVNERGELTEGAYTNLFLDRGGVLSTPPVDCGLLDGVLRRHLLREGESRVTEKVLFPADLISAERILVGNSVRGLVEVQLKGGQHKDIFRPRKDLQ